MILTKNRMSNGCLAISSGPSRNKIQDLERATSPDDTTLAS